MKKQYSPEEELLALKLAYHGIGAYAGRGKKSGNDRSLANPRVAGKLMRRIQKAGEKLQEKIGTDGKEEARKAVKALEKKPELCIYIERQFSGRDGTKINEDDVEWLLKLARKEGII